LKVTQDPISLYELLTKYQRLTVPRYQREYSWDNEQFSDLFNDILNADEESGHFFGSLLLYCENNYKMFADIIDGQQRITTFFLLLNAIKNYLIDYRTRKKVDIKNQQWIENSLTKINSCIFVVPTKLTDLNQVQIPRLVTGKRDNKLFIEILKGKDHKNVIDKTILSHQLILKASQSYFINSLREIDIEKNVVPIVNYLDKLFESKFIVMTAEKNADKVLLFKTLNARGLELAQSDLIKNEICKAVPENNIDDAIDTWDEIKTIIEKANGNIDTFLFHYLNSNNSSKKLRKEIEKKRGNKGKIKYSPIVPQKYVFEVFELLLKSSRNVFELLNEIKSQSEIYIDFISPKQKDKAYFNLVGLKALNITKCYPVLLAGKSVLNEKDFVKLANAIEVISFKHSILKEDPKELEILYYKILDKIYFTKDIKDSIDIIKDHSTNKRQKDFNDYFVKVSPKPITSKYILFRITRKYQESIEWGSKDIHLEHVMPKKPTGEWLRLKKQDVDKYDEYLNRVGNLTLLQDKLNQSASNKEFKTKKRNYYTKSRLYVTNMTFKKYSSWGYLQIVQRQKDLLKLVNNIWKL